VGSSRVWPHPTKNIETDECEMGKCEKYVEEFEHLKNFILHPMGK